jgi:hypothetical protein
MVGNNCPPGVPLICTWGPIYKGSYTRSLKSPYYPYLPTLVCHYAVTGSLQSFVIYKYFCATPMGMSHESPMSRH